MNAIQIPINIIYKRTLQNWSSEDNSRSRKHTTYTYVPGGAW